MDSKNIVIAWLSLQLFISGIALSKLAYDLGYERGRVHVLTTFDDNSDGTCLADKPPHKGACKK